MTCSNCPAVAGEECFLSSGEEKCRFDRVVDRIIALMTEFKWADRDTFAVNLAVVEAINNAIEHGNKFNPAKHFVVIYSVSENRVFVTVRDEGEGFDPGTVPDPLDEERLDFPSGRGLFLIRHAMDTVVFNNFGNEIHMTKHKKQPETTLAEPSPV